MRFDLNSDSSDSILDDITIFERGDIYSTQYFVLGTKYHYDTYWNYWKVGHNSLTFEEMFEDIMTSAWITNEVKTNIIFRLSDLRKLPDFEAEYNSAEKKAC